MWNYTEKVMDFFLHPRNVGELADADAVGEVGNLKCGDAMKLFLKIAPDGKTIVDASFQTFGCASAIASASALTEMLKGKTLEEAIKLSNQDIADYLGELPEEKMHCSVMGSEAFQAAMKNLHDAHPEWNVPVIETVEEGDDRIVCHCFNVTEGDIRKVIQANHLTTVEQVTHFTKAGGGCGECLEDIQNILNRVNAKASIVHLDKNGRPMAAEAKNEAAEAEAPRHLTNLQKITLIQKTLDSVIRPALQSDGGDVELIDIDGNDVIVKLVGACAGCPGAIQTLKMWVEAQLREKVAPELNVVPAK